jgi:hypothetical protein
MVNKKLPGRHWKGQKIAASKEELEKAVKKIIADFEGWLPDSAE